MLSTVCGLAGVVLIAKPSFIFPNEELQDSYPTIYSLVALTGAVLVGIGYTCQRAIASTVHPAVCTFYMSITVLAGGIVLNLVTGDQYVLPSCYTERIIMTACGIGACCALVMLNKGLSIEKSAPATLMRNMDIVIAFIVQIFLFHEDAEWRSVLGAVLIVAAAVSVTLERAFCPDYFWQI